MRSLVKIAAVGLVLSTASIYAQSGGPPPGPRGMGGPGGGPFGHMGPGFGGGFGKVVTGAPYSADVSNQSVQTLSDGNTVQHSTTGHISRDAVGRLYSQETITGGPLGQQGPVVVTFINDPVAGYSYVLNANTKVATRRAIRTPPSGTPSDWFDTAWPEGLCKCNDNGSGYADHCRCHGAREERHSYHPGRDNGQCATDCVHKRDLVFSGPADNRCCKTVRSAHGQFNVLVGEYPACRPPRLSLSSAFGLHGPGRADGPFGPIPGPRRTAQAISK